MRGRIVCAELLFIWFICCGEKLSCRTKLNHVGGEKGVAPTYGGISIVLRCFFIRVSSVTTIEIWRQQQTNPQYCPNLDSNSIFPSINDAMKKKYKEMKWLPFNLIRTSHSCWSAKPFDDQPSHTYFTPRHRHFILLGPPQWVREKWAEIKYAWYEEEATEKKIRYENMKNAVANWIIPVKAFDERKPLSFHPRQMILSKPTVFSCICLLPPCYRDCCAHRSIIGEPGIYVYLDELSFGM